MKFTRVRRHIRPRLNRRQINQETARVSSAVRLFQIEWLAESARPEPSPRHMHTLDDSIQTLKDELDSLVRQ